MLSITRMRSTVPLQVLRTILLRRPGKGILTGIGSLPFDENPDSEIVVNSEIAFPGYVW